MLLTANSILNLVSTAFRSGTIQIWPERALSPYISPGPITLTRHGTIIKPLPLLLTNSWSCKGTPSGRILNLVVVRYNTRWWVFVHSVFSFSPRIPRFTGLTTSTTKFSTYREGRRDIWPKWSFEHPTSAAHRCDRKGWGRGSAVGYRSRLIDPGNRS
jgi:hypothetical protein